jgi:glycine betaine/proline transport system substrate-binding protein
MKRQLAVTVAGSILGIQTALAEAPESTQPIRIALNEWAGQQVTAKIAGTVLERMGYSVEYVTAGATTQYVAMAEGALHFQPEVWTYQVGDIYPAAVERGDIVEIGPLGIEPRQGWIYPPYMEDRCPGLPHYTALFDCAMAFGVPETFPAGRLVVYPADWGTYSPDLVETLGLPFRTIFGGSEGAMIAELRAAYDAQQPILMDFWAPHWIHAEYAFHWVEWDETTGDCDTTAGQEVGEACGFPQGEVVKVMARNMPETWPAAVRFAEAFELDNQTQNQLILQVDRDGRDVEAVVAEWAAASEDVIAQWVEAARE